MCCWQYHQGDHVNGALKEYLLQEGSTLNYIKAFTSHIVNLIY